MSFKVEDYIGSRFGKLVITKDGGNDAKLGRMAVVICDCGNERVYPLTVLRIGRRTTCGCTMKNGTERQRNPFEIKTHPLYKVWRSMKQRCYNKKCSSYKNYGGRGVIVCYEWIISASAFIYWGINNGWENGLELDKDIKGNGLLYSPETCCFVTTKVNMNAIRRNKIFNFDGTNLTASQLADKFDLNKSTLLSRIEKGMDVYTACYKIVSPKYLIQKNKSKLNFSLL